MIFFFKETNRETSNNESLADDNTTLAVLEERSLRKVRNILNDFGDISGLRCNFDKSNVMLTSDPDPEDLILINNLGFTVTNSIKLLGVTIKSSLDNIDEIFTGIADKIVNAASFWDRFKLSLPGRISIAKTFLVSQLNYIGCFLSPSDEIIERIQVILDNFVKKNINISKKRISLPVEYSGLGMFNVRTYLQSQMCSWVARAYRLPIDNWQYDLKLSAPHHNIALLRPCDLNAELHPILYNIIWAYRDFYGNFTRCDNNYLKAFIFDNPAICHGPDYTGTLDRNFFGRQFYTENVGVIRKLTFSDCFVDLSFKTLAEFREMNLNLTPATWMRLRSALLHFRNSLTNRPNASNKCTEIENFLNRPVKGSKRFRNYFNRVLLGGEDLTTYRSVLTFADLTDVPVLPVSLLKNSLNIWNISFLGNNLREFIFKCRNNYLLVNARVAAFDNTVDLHCTFCRIRYRNPLPRETFTHLFFDCPTTNDIRISLLMQFFMFDLNPMEIKNFFWNGMVENHEKLQPILLLFWEIFRYHIFRCKLNRNVPNSNLIKNSIFFTLRTTLYNNSHSKALINGSPSLARWLPALG
jgi:hypothetical protein